MNEKEYLKAMGSKIRARRDEKGISLMDLGKRCSIHYSSISQIESGNRSSMVLTLKRIADELDADVKDFL